MKTERHPAPRPTVALNLRAWLTWALLATTWWLVRASLRMVRRTLFRNRHVFGPIGAALLVWVLAGLVRSVGPGASVIYVGGLLWAGGLWVFRSTTAARSALDRWTATVPGPEWIWSIGRPVVRAVRTGLLALVPDHLDAGHKGVLDRPKECAYLSGLLAFSSIWSLAFVALGPSWPLLVVLAAGLCGFGGPWALHRRIRRSRLAFRYAAKWERVRRSDTVPAAHRSRVVSVEGGPAPRLRVKLSPGRTEPELARSVRQIGSLLKLRPGAVHIGPDRASERHAWVTLVPSDPWKTDLPHPVILDGSPLTTIKEQGKWVSVGLKSNGRRDGFALNHVFAAGKSGGGKSGFIHALMTDLTRFTDAVIVGADLAGGATLRVWESCLATPLATTPDETVVLMEQLLRVIEYRECALGKPVDLDDEDVDEADAFEPSPERPWWFFVIDELPILWAAGDDALYLWNQIMKRARKCGVWVIAAAQNGTKADTGSKEAQYQFKVMVGMRLEGLASKHYWGPDLARMGWTSTDLGVGQCRIRDDDHADPEITKVWWVPMRDRKRHIKAVGRAGEVPPDEHNVFLGVGVDAELVARNLAQERARYVAQGHGSSEFDDSVLAALADTDSPTAIARTLNCNRSKVIRALHRLAKQGLTSQNKSGRGWHRVMDEVSV